MTGRLGLGTRALVGGFFLGCAALLALLPRDAGALAPAAATIGLVSAVLPTRLRRDPTGFSFTLLGLPGGAARWEDVAAVITERAPLRRTHVTQILCRGRPRVTVFAEVGGYVDLLAELRRRVPDALCPESIALAERSRRPASLERVAWALVVAELVAFGVLAARFGGA